MPRCRRRSSLSSPQRMSVPFSSYAPGQSPAAGRIHFVRENSWRRTHFLRSRHKGHVRFGSKADICSAKRHVRSYSKSGHVRCNSVCPLCAMCGRLRVGKNFLHILQPWSVQPCVRPLSAAHGAAGHNALRGPGPDQKHAFDDALAQVGCPDRRIDRLRITCCSPSQPSHHAGGPTRFVYAASATLRLVRAKFALSALLQRKEGRENNIK